MQLRKGKEGKTKVWTNLKITIPTGNVVPIFGLAVVFHIRVKKKKRTDFYVVLTM